MKRLGSKYEVITKEDNDGVRGKRIKKKKIEIMNF